jgi:hypothetical protein
MSMLTVLLVITVAGIAIWIGWTAREERISLLTLLGLSIGFLAAALLLYGWQCDAASIPDILLFRDVPGQFFCSGRLTLFAYIFLFAIPVAIVRNLLERYMT